MVFYLLQRVWTCATEYFMRSKTLRSLRHWSIDTFTFGPFFGRWSLHLHQVREGWPPPPRTSTRALSRWPIRGLCLLAYLEIYQKKKESITKLSRLQKSTNLYLYGTKHRQARGFLPGAGQESKNWTVILPARTKACATRSTRKNVSLAYWVPLNLHHCKPYVSYIYSFTF